ncbi:MAG TPA: HAD-IB family phosphatase [Candidatus Thermoplasmatota archaeon]|nr:HAD-IB family phosphatase [Candidatus Thermoplasmatota archaeon]
MPTPTHRSRREAIDLANGWLQMVSTHRRPPRDEIHPDRRGRFELVLFDMDGTLVDKLSSWEMIHHALGVSNAANWERYSRGEIDDHEFMRSDIELWKLGGREIHVEEIESILATAELMPGAKECMDALHARGIATGIMSGGLDVLAHRVAVDLGMDMYVANGLALDDAGRVAGKGICFVEIRDKGRPTREVLSKLGVPKERVAAVGNSVWDAPMFAEASFSVAVNPADYGVRKAATRVVEGKDLREVLAHLLEADRA